MARKDKDTLWRKLAIERLESRALLSSVPTLSQVRSFDLWDGDIIPSTDGAGVTYDPVSGSLYISDSEINENSEFEGVNIFSTSLLGDQLFLELASNNSEPTGITYSEFDGYFYITNDDDATISRYDRQFNLLAEITTSDAVSNAHDPEGIGSDPSTGLLYVADGVDGGRQVLVYDANLQYQYRFSFADRINDGEGIAVHPQSGHLFIVSSPDETVYQYLPDGTYLDEFSISDFSPAPVGPQGLTFAPSSSSQDHPSRLSLYIVDLGVDNSPDGWIYEAEFLGVGPEANDDIVTTTFNTPVLIPATANDDVGNPPTRITSVTQAGNGVVNFGFQNVHYAPINGYSGIDSFSYTITDDDGLSSTATISVTVFPPNVTPVAVDDDLQTTEDTRIRRLVLSNDQIGNPPTQILSVTSANNGTVSFVNAHKSWVTYDPDPDFVGADSFTYTLQDWDGETSSATVNVTVTNANDIPLAADDTLFAIGTDPVTRNVLSNDQLAEAPTQITSVTSPSIGTVIFDAQDGTVTYTPIQGLTGPDSFDYTITDADGETSTATVHVHVAAVSSAVSVRVEAGTDDAEEAASGAISIASGDLDLVTTSTLQTVGMRFNNVLIPSGATIVSASVQFQTEEVNDELTSLWISGEATDHSETFSSSSGNVTSRPLTSNAVPWAPPPWETIGEAGPDQRTPDIADVIQEIVDRPGWLRGNSLSLIVTGSGKRTAESYNGSPTAAPLLLVEYVGMPPMATDDVVETVQNLAVTTPVMENDEPGEEPTQVTTVTQGNNGMVVIDPGGLTTTYTPNLDFIGSDSYIYTLTDAAGQQSTATVQVTVQPANLVPAAVDDVTETIEDRPWVSTAVLINDQLGNLPTNITSVTDGAHGLVTFNAESHTTTYLPQPDFSGVDSYTYTITDADGDTSTATVSVFVMGLNDTPLANDDVDSTSEQTPVSTLVLANDDLGDPVTLVTAVTQGNHGTVSIDPSGTSVTYSPNAGFFGFDSYTYTMTDADGETSSANVDLTVFPTPVVVEVRVSDEFDDAEESATGVVSLSSRDLEMVFDSGGNQIVGMRFTNVAIPSGVTILQATIQFQVDEPGTQAASLNITGESTGHALAFSSAANDLSSRPTTTASVAWSPAPWATVGEAGPDQQTPDISPLIEEIVSGANWVSGNALAILISGSGERVAESYDGTPVGAPLLQVEYQPLFPNQSGFVLFSETSADDSGDLQLTADVETALSVARVDEQRVNEFFRSVPTADLTDVDTSIAPRGTAVRIRPESAVSRLIDAAFTSWELT